MEAGELVGEHPVLFHVAAAGAWPSIRAHGLLSTAAALDRCAPADPAAGRVRAWQAAGLPRRRSVVLDVPGLGPFTVRDQLPLRHLDRCLEPGVTPAQFLAALDHRVFLWASRARVARLLGARRQAAVDSDVLHLDTARLLARWGGVVQVSAYNSGATYTPAAPRRGPGLFAGLADDAVEVWRSRRPRGGAVVEVVLPWAVPDAAAFVTRVQRWHGGAPVADLDPAPDTAAPVADADAPVGPGGR